MNAPIITSESYAHRIWRHLYADNFARNGLWIMLALFVVAALAPLLANSHALVRVADGHLSFPVFYSLDPIEWRFLFYVPLAGVAYLLRAWLFASPARAILVLLGLIVLVEIFIALYHPINDPTNDRERAASFKIMAPIPYSPTETTPDQFIAPSWKHLCGTDSTGRDIAARMLHGARISLSVGFVSQGIAVFIAVIVGSIAGYYRGWIDVVVCRVIEIVDCFPGLLLILVIVNFTGSQNNIFCIMAVIGVTSWTGSARLVRGEFLRLSSLPFTLSARALGASDFRIIVRHLLPNALGPIMVVATFGVASAILLESSLSFLGYGIQAPTPSWGDILSEARKYIDFAWWLAFFPGLAILITIMSYNFVGEGLRDAVDPRMKVK